MPKSTDKRIDFARLRQSPAGSPILFYDEVCLYEDEMGDNGHAEFTVKLRVMSFGVFVLVRNLIRVDQVIFKCTEHRYFIDFQQDSLILAETRRKSDPYDVLLAKLGGSVAAVCSQADQVADQMSIISSNTVEFG